MALPLNIDDLIHQRKVESARIEYKKDWNPEKVLHSVCAFANDIDNWGGGYIILGVEEKNGIPVLPPYGIRKESVDAVNKELLNVCNLLEGRYVPVVSHEVYEGADILVLWCPASAVRPHKCPVVIAKNAKSEKAYYIRKANSTIKANAAEERELFEYAGKVPFDERPNMRASVSDIRMSLLLPFLESVGSELAKDAAARSVADVARDMLLLEGPPEDEHPINAALMFFNEHPERFFHYAWIEVVDKPDPTGQGMEEQTFKGPLDVQLRAALNYIRGVVLKEKIFKHDDRAEADRIWNYPYAAVEEALANAVYHRSYEPCAPVEVTITPTQLEISSLPGMDRSITDANLKDFNIRSRFYRNRRIGEFLKELDLAEGRNTGIGKIVRAMRDGDLELVRKLFTAFLAETPYSMRPKKDQKDRELYFHYTFYLLMRLISCYTVYTEKQLSEGRADCIVETPKYVYIFEFKLDGTASEALQQIRDRGYAKAYEADTRPVYMIGASFSSKTGTIEEWEEIKNE